MGGGFAALHAVYGYFFLGWDPAFEGAAAFEEGEDAGAGGGGEGRCGG